MTTKSSMKYYPKVLIIGSPFNKKTGGGITMSNLFQGWPKDRLAVASNANIIIEADTLICENYFQLGFSGKLHPFPLNIVLPKVYCGPLKISDANNSGASKPIKSSSRYKKIYNILRNILEFFGVFNLLYAGKINDDFKEWIADFNPDIIYSQLASLGSIRLVSDVADILKKPVALHFMDDWITTINGPGIFYFYWKKRIEAELLSLINRSSVLMSIGEAMSEEYYKRYNKTFFPFHNPIDINIWLPYCKNNWSLQGRFTIVYAGRVGLGSENSIIDVARVVNSLSDKYEDLVFEIFSPDITKLNGKVNFSNNVIGSKSLAHNGLPKKYSEVDLLLLPIDFDSKSIKFLKYSFQTKISEYMISGTPVLVYAPKGTSTAMYAIRDKWAYTVTERSDLLLENAILDLYSKPDLRRRIGEKAKQLAITREDSNIVREKFRKCLTSELE
jgi:glycosyltransferase involved in cell wall biosynthesis